MSICCSYNYKWKIVLLQKIEQQIDTIITYNNSSAKSLIKHLLEQDVSKRYGCLKDGVKDIYESKWFKGFDWKALNDLSMQPPYVPKIK